MTARLTPHEKLIALRAEMKAQKLDGFIIPRADEFQGEFVAPYAERLKYLTGFTGSGGVAAVLQDKAVALTDGRYLIQIEQQVDSALFDTGDMTKTPIEDWLSEQAAQGDVIGYDPWLHTSAQCEKLENKGIKLKAVAQNPLDTIWTDQPARPQSHATLFPDIIAGQSAAQKKQDISQMLKGKSAKACIITQPDSIAWLLNIRGADIACIPQILSYAVLYADGDRPISWIVEPQKVPSNIEVHLKNTAEIIDPKAMDQHIAIIEGPVILDETRSPHAFKIMLEKNSIEIITAEDPCIAPKAIKTPPEKTAIKKAHQLDAVALVKFLHWAAKEREEGATEWSIGEKIKEFRAQAPAFQGESFPCISGFGENGAIIHYRATPESSSPIKGSGLLLVDSGGQYFDPETHIAGTTDITRTIGIIRPSQEMKENFTRVLKGHIALAMAHFPEGTTGAQLDTLARQSLWSRGLDFAHGTGHGVGCYLAVHEDSASISPRGQNPLKAGMLLSNEPGYYKEGAYGIRIENLIMVQEAGSCKETGKPMLSFETISFAPIDQSLILPELLDQDEKEWLNAYHKETYERTAPYLDKKTQDWLKEQTKPV